MSPQQSDPRELIGPFVLGACTPGEAADVRAHMTASAAFRAEVESFDVVHDALLEAPEVDVAPGLDLKRSIMARVQAEASLFAAAGPDEREAIRREVADADPATPISIADLRSSDDASGAHAARVEAPVRGAGEPAPSGRRNAFLEALRHPARASALALVLVALVVGGIVLGSGPDTEEYIGRPSADAGASATVRLVAKKGDNKLRLAGFPAAAAGKEYQVWLQSGTSAPEPTQVLFQVDGEGNAEATIPGELKDVDDVLVTAEPEGGSPAPTSNPILHVEI